MQLSEIEIISLDEYQILSGEDGPYIERSISHNYPHLYEKHTITWSDSQDIKIDKSKQKFINIPLIDITPANITKFIWQHDTEFYKHCTKYDIKLYLYKDKGNLLGEYIYKK